jgi:hypothetical protein
VSGVTCDEGARAMSIKDDPVWRHPRACHRDTQTRGWASEDRFAHLVSVTTTGLLPSSESELPDGPMRQRRARAMVPQDSRMQNHVRPAAGHPRRALGVGTD